MHTLYVWRSTACFCVILLGGVVYMVKHPKQKRNDSMQSPVAH